MSMKTLGVNGLWMALCLPDAIRFHRGTHAVESVQRDILSQLLRDNQKTRFGQDHHFDRIHSAEEFRTAVPLADYEAYHPAIEAMKMDGVSPLTFQRPLRLVPTSGSTTASKLIPYTPQLRQEFQQGLAPWIVDQFIREPTCLTGSAYWSVSPAIPQIPSPSRIPIGFDDDTAYLSPLIQRLLPTCMAVPPFVAKIQDMETFRYVTLLFLLKARDLTFVSIWNPTFFSLLLSPLNSWALRLADDLEAGHVQPDAIGSTPLRSLIQAHLGRHPKRATEIRAILASSASGTSILYARLWRRLKLISCWTDAAATGAAEDLQKAFPDTIISPKGLLATEGIVSIPIGRPEGSALAIRSHFFEFLEDNDSSRSKFGWQLEQGRLYEVVLTTGGGLYRYRLGDRIRVTGFLDQCPLLQFVGRCDKVSDWYGEKLNESHVATILQSLLARHYVQASFAMLVPDGEPRPSHYALLLAGTPGSSLQTIRVLEEELEVALRANFHYDYCRKLGQLKPVQVKWLSCGSKEAGQRYLQSCMSDGRKIGDIKPVTLDGRLGWPKALDFPNDRRNEEVTTG